jgi:hypothetical protein
MRGAIIRIASGLMTYTIGARSSEVSKASPNSALIQWRRRREVIVEVLEERLKEELAEGLEGAPEEELEETTEELEETPEEELVEELVSCELRI